MQNKCQIIAVFMLLAFLPAGCVTSGYSREGTIEKIEEPLKAQKAQADEKFNEATELLVNAFNSKTSEVDNSKIDKALNIYKEAEKLSPNDSNVKKQIGIIYEFFKNDEKMAYRYYKEYKRLRGSDPEVLSAVEDMAKKYENREK